jgi:hypothetical protein
MFAQFAGRGVKLEDTEMQRTAVNLRQRPW